MTTFPQYTVQDVTQPVDAVLWTPPSLGMNNIVSWHDASDTTTLEADAGYVVRRLDKSGNNRHLDQTAIPINRPAVASNYDYYTGSDSMIIVGESAAYTTGDTYFILLAMVGYYGGTTPIVTCGTSPNGFGWDIRASYGTTLRTNSSNKYLWHTSSSYNSMFQHMYGSSSWAKARAQSSYQSGDWNNLSTTVTPVSGLNFVVGGYASGMYMRFYEMLALSMRPSDAQIEYITAYFAHKWDALLGISTYRGFLASNNPFKNSPPIITVRAAFPRMYDGIPGSI